MAVETVTMREFNLAIEGLSRQIDEVNATSRATLNEVKITNGRVNGLEKVTTEHAVKLKNLEREVFDDRDRGDRVDRDAYRDPDSVNLQIPDENKPLTRRDLAVFVCAIYVVVEWIPKIWTALRLGGQ